ncbi:MULTISPECIES: glucosaminidase domain-containing protein [unclassified Enterococcus]|uniref:glucosaminidase domain-containing protein n=1 Tax=unclassified Enterococcus TaxID=2608891 RepID=UPI001A9207C7|nr:MULTISPECIES: glucosaminidase domain-containing protein [unclassified Enterococcus]MBO0461690.1 glucosaminidase domain-containing protein [Enterococcus sp. DIV1298c]MBO1298982.1 glucosaminidase domain-containing protein [Enterococcus sp. DIV1271a]
MKVSILLASIMLLNASLSPCIALAETVTTNNQQIETTSSSITDEKTTNVISPTTISSTNEEIPLTSTDNPTIIGTPQLIGESYKDGISKPKRINLSATEATKQAFIEDEENKKTTHSYIGGNTIYEINSTDVQVPTPPTTDSSTIQLAVYTRDVSQTKQTLAYYLAQQFKTYQLSLENLKDILSIDPALAMEEDSLSTLIQEYYPQVSEKITIQEIEDLTDQYGSVQETPIFPTLSRQENSEMLTGRVILTQKTVLSNHTTWFFAKNADQYGWIAAEAATSHTSHSMSENEKKGTLTSNASLYSTLTNAWLDVPDESIDTSTVYDAKNSIEIEQSTFYELSVDGIIAGYVQKENFQLNDDSNVIDGTSKRESSSKITSNVLNDTPELYAENHQDSSITERTTQQPILTYGTHIRNIGWLPEVTNGELSGTTGRVLPVEALRLNLNSSLQGAIEYTSYVEQNGWQNWVTQGNISGTVGQAKQIEGIKLRLTGQLSNQFNIFYRVHVKNMGWLPWANNGNPAGSIGYKFHIEAIEIRLVDQSQTGPSVGDSYLEKDPSILARSHVTNRGWLDEKDAATFVGTTGQNLSLQAIQLRLTENTIGGGINYQAHVANQGWESSWRSNGSTSGTTGLNLPIEAIRINLTGVISTRYDIYYRIHAQNFGWLDWAKNGENAGTQGYATQSEAIQIKLVPKGGAAPGATSRAFRLAPPRVNLQGHLSTNGWISRTGLTTMINFANQSRQFEAIRATLANSSYSGTISYDSHLTNIGWTKAVSNGTISGTTGQNRPLQAFSFNLTEELAEHYDIYYRSFVRSRGWLGWASNGQKAGSVGMNLPIEAIEVTIVENDRKPSGYKANQLTILGQIDTSTAEGRFVNSITQSANRVAPAYGLYTSVMLAQAILETGYGTSFLARNANNFFGMKFKDGEDEGKYNFIWHVSNEVINGATVPVNSKFRVYQSTDESFKDNAVKLKYGVPWDPVRYRGTWKVNTRSYRDATRALTGTYATDPDYGTKLNNIIERWRLDQFD